MYAGHVGGGNKSAKPRRREKGEEERGNRHGENGRTKIIRQVVRNLLNNVLFATYLHVFNADSYV